MGADPFDLQRFVTAQASIFAQVLSELRGGRKRTHWMWFVFPQIAGLGSSPTAQHYAIRSRPEAHAYVAHPLLGPRLLQATTLVLQQEVASAHAIFGSPDDLKFRSSMTLFAQASSDAAPFRAALDRFYDGQPDQRTLERLRHMPGEPGALSSG